jgi:hypothetical protein
VLCLLSYVRVMKPPAGIEPAPRPYKGRVLAVDTTEACRWRRWESNPLLLVASEALFRSSYIPRCGRVESNHHSRRPRGYSPLSSPVLSVRKEGRVWLDSNCRRTTTTPPMPALPASAAQRKIRHRSRTLENHHVPRSGRDFQRREGGRPDSNRNLEDHDLGCCRYTTTTMHRCRFRRHRLITVG